MNYQVQSSLSSIVSKLLPTHPFSVPYVSLCVSLSVALIMTCGCASAPPAPEAPKTPTWAEALSAAQLSVTPKPPRRVRVTHELWSATQDVPTLNRVESGLAEAGVVADSGGTEGSYQVTVGQAECEVSWREIDDEASQTRASRSSRCGDQLNATQRKRLERAQRLVTVSCQGVRGQPTGEGNMLDLHNVAVGVSKAARYPNLGDGELPAQEAPAPIWIETSQLKCGEISKLNRYSSDDHIRTARYKLDDRRWAVRTVGLEAFGLEDLALLMISEADLESAEASVIARADFAIRFEGLGEGQTASSGSAEGVYVKMNRAAQHLEALKSVPEALRGVFVIVNPSARVNDLDAFTRVNGRFATP